MNSKVKCPKVQNPSYQNDTTIPSMTLVMRENLVRKSAHKKKLTMVLDSRALEFNFTNNFPKKIRLWQTFSNNPSHARNNVHYRYNTSIFY